MKRIGKIVIYFSLVCALGLWIFVLHCKSLAKERLGETGWNSLCERIENAPELPGNFIQTYQTVYPRIFNRDCKAVIAGSLLGGRYRVSPSLVLTRTCWMLFSDSTDHDRKYEVGLVFLLEEKFTQKECFTAYIRNWDFGYNVKGLEQASMFYYQKPIQNLSLDEQLGLILRMDNPFLYNNKRHPDIYKNAVGRLRKVYQENVNR